MNRKTALITGSSSGIGYELSHLFGRDGYDLVLVARSKDALERIAAELEGAHGIAVQVIVKDLSEASAVEEICRTLKDSSIEIDVLVNNAGYGVYGEFLETDETKEMRMMQLNMLSLTQLTKKLLPSMLAKGNGKVLNVASTAAFQPGPSMAVYYATKAFVLSFSEAIAEELSGRGVTVTALCPGPTASGFQINAKMEKSKLFRGKVMDAKTVAEIGYAAMGKGKRVSIPGVKNCILAQAVRIR